jgi:hypothetical protein
VKGDLRSLTTIVAVMLSIFALWSLYFFHQERVAERQKIATEDLEEGRWLSRGGMFGWTDDAVSGHLTLSIRPGQEPFVRALAPRAPRDGIAMLRGEDGAAPAARISVRGAHGRDSTIADERGAYILNVPVEQGENLLISHLVLERGDSGPPPRPLVVPTP